ncbi:hypothetical protein [Herbidospora yilanensis]|uniref:hypothetical protein n=1 Tax=Herbidospora yilanensis TaxID=354426 RepID=UPI0007846560|nr:hypothetical protein [Herbidospora yilanensis]
MRILRKVAALGITAAAAAATVMVSASPAAAVLYGNQCGSGYNVVNVRVFPDGRGTVYLTYNASTKKNCVVTLRETPGAATFMEAYIRRSGTTTWLKDSGNFTTYAGPVYLSAPGSCVDWGGTIGTHSVGRDGTNCG